MNCENCNYDMGESFENCGASEDGLCPECSNQVYHPEHKQQKNTMKTQTTEQIKNTLGANYTVEEVETMLATMQRESDAQAPCFDGRLLDRIQRLKTALGE